MVAPPQVNCFGQWPVRTDALVTWSWFHLFLKQMWCRVGFTFLKCHSHFPRSAFEIQILSGHAMSVNYDRKMRGAGKILRRSIPVKEKLAATNLVLVLALGKPSFKKNVFLWKFFTNGGGGSVCFHTLIQKFKRSKWHILGQNRMLWCVW